MHTSIVVRLLPGLGLIASLLIAGCGSSYEEGAETPEEAVERFALGMAEQDRNQMLSVVRASDEERAAVEGMYRLSVAQRNFEEAARSEYGDTAAAIFGAPSGANGGMLAPDEFAESLDQLEVDVQEDTATATLGPQEQMNLVRADGRWFIDVSGLTQDPTGESSPAELAEQFHGMAEVFENNLAHIDASEMSADELARKVGQEMMSVVMPEMPTPPAN